MTNPIAKTREDFQALVIAWKMGAQIEVWAYDDEDGKFRWVPHRRYDSSAEMTRLVNSLNITRIAAGDLSPSGTNCMYRIKCTEPSAPVISTVVGDTEVWGETNGRAL